MDSLMTPIEKIDQAFLQLAYAIKLVNYVENEKFKKQDFDIDLTIKARFYVEKIGPLADEFGRELGKEVACRANLPENLSQFISLEEILGYLEKKKINCKKPEGIIKDYLKTYLNHKNIKSYTYYCDDYFKKMGNFMMSKTQIQLMLTYPRIVRSQKSFFHRF